jgi:acetyl esterase/lipase
MPAFRYESWYYDSPIVSGRALDLFRGAPDAAPRRTSLFFVHGGGWRAGSRQDWHPIMHAFGREGFTCGSVDYRLVNVDIRHQLEDIRMGLHLFNRWLLEHGRNPQVFVIGISAGAHLGALLTLAEPGACGEQTDSLNVAPLIGAAFHAMPASFQPWEDIFPGAWQAMQEIVGEGFEQAPERYSAVSPIAHLSAHSPPLLLLHAENEHMFPLSELNRFRDKAVALGVRVELKNYSNCEHGFFYELIRRQQRQAFTDIVRFIESVENTTAQ